MRQKSLAALLSCFFLLGLVPAFSINLREKIRDNRVRIYLRDREEYISLRSVLRLLNADNSWGRIDDRIFFVTGGREFVLRLNSPDAKVDGRFVQMARPAIEVEGEVLIAVASLEKLLEEADRGGSPAAGPALPPGAGDVRAETESRLAPAGTSSYTIFIDPGHGADDSGAIGPYGLKEKDVNLDVSLRLRGYLKRELRNCPQVRIVMSRETDVFYPLERRVQMAREAKADMFFCVHTNSSKWNRYNADGFETFYPRQKEEMTVLPTAGNPEGLAEADGAESVLLQIVSELNATTVIDESRILADIVQERLAERLYCPDRGAKPANFYVLKYSPMVSVLTEIGFICNPNIEANLRDPDVRQAIGETLGKAIIDYLKRKGVVSGGG